MVPPTIGTDHLIFYPAFPLGMFVPTSITIVRLELMTRQNVRSGLAYLVRGPICRNPTLAKCGGEAQHLEKLEVGSLPGLPNV